MGKLVDIKSKWLKIGFTLTELLVVVIIIGILATLALPMLVKTLEKAKVGEAISNLNLIRTGQKIYFLERSLWSTDIDYLNIENPNEPSSRYFDYTIPTVTQPPSANPDFTARAQRRDNAPNPYNTYYYEIKKDGTITSNGPLI
jgi:prepilin-type N-terminal cleavage/methylation domain-containing protein